MTRSSSSFCDIYHPRTDALDHPGMDIIGDVHGCFDELADLLRAMGWHIGGAQNNVCDPIRISHPDNRKLVFCGDLTDRGPGSDKVLRLLIGGQATGAATMVIGNHDWKLYRWLCGRAVKIGRGLETTIEQISPLGDAFLDRVRRAIAAAPHQIRVTIPPGHPWADRAHLTIVHGAAMEHRQDACDRKSFERSIYGYPANDKDIDGIPIRIDWAEDYRGQRPVIHGHTARKRARILNKVMCLDTGCVFGNALSAYRLDSHSIWRVPARTNHSGKDKILLP